MVQVVYAPEANDYLIEIAGFIAHDNPEVARRWIRKIRDTCDTFVTQPAMGKERPGFGVPG